MARTRATFSFAARRLAALAASRAFNVVLLLSVLALLLFSGLFRGGASESSCRITPRVVSHRGVDEDEHGPKPTTMARVVALLDDGFTSFDIDLFWPADGASLFIGHPPSVRKLWSLPEEVHATPLATLRTRSQPDGLLALSELLSLLSARRASLAGGMVSLELKFPSHREWTRMLRVLYAQVAQHGAAAYVAAVVGGPDEAAAHRAAQSSAGVRVPLLCVLRDIDAPTGSDGQPHANASAMRLAARHYDAWAPSWKLIEPSLRSAAAGLPLSVWAVDTEEQLRRVFLHSPRDVISNRPRWARRTLAKWQKEECGATTSQG